MYKKVERVQILPMSVKGFDNEYTDINYVQFDYLLNDLTHNKNGKYYYEVSGISSPKNTLILFKYETQIVGSGILVGKNYDSEGKYLQFDKKSILIFYQPITIDEMRIVWSDFKEYGQSKKFLDLSQLDYFLKTFSHRIIDKIDTDELFQIRVELSNPNDNVIIDEPIPKKEDRWLLAKYSNRNSLIAKKAIIKTNFKCELNFNHEYFISKYSGKNYVEVHHLIPVEFQSRFENSLDVDSNIVVLCPVCHKMIHYASLNDKIQLLMKLFNDRKRRLKLTGINITQEELLELYS